MDLDGGTPSHTIRVKPQDGGDGVSYRSDDDNRTGNTKMPDSGDGKDNYAGLGADKPAIEVQVDRPSRKKQQKFDTDAIRSTPFLWKYKLWATLVVLLFLFWAGWDVVYFLMAKDDYDMDATTYKVAWLLQWGASLFLIIPFIVQVCLKHPYTVPVIFFVLVSFCLRAGAAGMINDQTTSLRMEEFWVELCWYAMWSMLFVHFLLMCFYYIYCSVDLHREVARLKDAALRAGNQANQWSDAAEYEARMQDLYRETNELRQEKNKWDETKDILKDNLLKIESLDQERKSLARQLEASHQQAAELRAQVGAAEAATEAAQAALEKGSQGASARSLSEARPGLRGTSGYVVNGAGTGPGSAVAGGGGLGAGDEHGASDVERQLRLEVDGLTQRLHDYEEEVKEELLTLRSENAALKAQAMSSGGLRASEAVQIQTLKADHAREVGRLQGQLREAVHQRRLMEQQLQEAWAFKDDSKDVAVLQEQLHHVERDRDTLKEKVMGVTRTLQQTNTAQASELEHKTKECRRLKEKVRSLENAMTNLDQQYHEHRTVCPNLRKDTEAAKERAAHLKLMLERMRARHESTHTQMKKQLTTTGEELAESKQEAMDRLAITARARELLRSTPVHLGVDLREGPVNGVLVLAVARGSPAFRAGLRQGDVIEQVNGRDTSSGVFFRNVIGSVHPGDEVAMQVERMGNVCTVMVPLGGANMTDNDVERLKRQARGDIDGGDLLAHRMQNQKGSIAPLAPAVLHMSPSYSGMMSDDAKR